MMRKTLHSGGMIPPSFGPIRSHCGRLFPDLSHFAVISKRRNVNCKACLRCTKRSRAYWSRAVSIRSPRVPHVANDGAGK
jgi:hypothetical protein